ncbi:MAG TPA: error-prone DNA polymerase [Caulobacteraceae bacterium]|jgi:error-prone DNA polymerase|nr:error-prone DNA polymerase [Caulobacteraceae bacterium]
MYAELQVTTNYGFLRGASRPEELAFTAKGLGLAAIAVTDRNSLAGVVQAHAVAREVGLRFVLGCRLVFADGTPDLLCYPTSREAYGRLTKLLTVGQLRAQKGGCELHWEDLVQHGDGQLLIVVPPATLDAGFEAALRRTARDFPGRVWLAATRGYAAQDVKRIAALDALGRRCGAPIVATGDILYHAPERRPLQDVMTCIREKCSIQTAGLRLEANAERHLKTPVEMGRLFKAWPEAVARTLEIAERCRFSLDELKYEYPDEPVPPGMTAIEYLKQLAWAGADWRYPGGVPQKVKDLLNKELILIEELGYPNYFITVHDIVQWARQKNILCQGRGSAANSSVCFCLGVTAVDPCKPHHDVLFERFISKERDEPPDIDVDFEHERREEVMQYVYERYGRHRAAIVATVIHYRPRSAIRDVGKALGLTEDITAALADTVWGSWGDGVPDEHIRQAGLDPTNPEIRRAVDLATDLLGFPRHLSQHVGGFVLTKRRLDETVPIGNAAMKDRTFLEWDKDDIDILKLMKVDVLALGMLTAIAKAMVMLRQDHGRADLQDIADIPEDDPAVYDMLCKADSVGVFQVESRAQMSMLPRLKPREFYDLVIEVAIVRPGPIQGDMVHPYLRRRDKLEPVSFPAPSPEHGPADELEDILGKTMGVPLFQEQAMKLAMVAAKFTPDEANGLRRSMATFRNLGTIGEYGRKFTEGMVARGYDPEFAQRCFKQIEGFGSYGFPESHAVSFAKLVYISAWIKCHYPDVFCAALLNSQPMGFYQPAQLVRDAREHGVTVLAPDVMLSDWDSTLEPPPPRGEGAGGGGLPQEKVRCPNPRSRLSGERPPPPAPPLKGEGRAVRLGLHRIRGLKKEEALALIAARKAGAATLEDLARHARLSRRSLELLAEADAFRSLGMDRREGLWVVKALAPEGKASADAPLLAGLGLEEDPVDLPKMRLPAHVAEDYRTTGLSLKAHPCRFFRSLLTSLGAVPTEQLRAMRDGQRVTIGGLVLIRQRPGTAKGVVFATLEDETGVANAVVWQDVFNANRRTVMTSSFLVVTGKLQVASGVIHVVAERFIDLTPRLAQMRLADGTPPGRSAAAGRMQRSRDFH